MAIQVRRGNESDFDASKMLPGEWAVSLDTKYVRMCFSPGVVLRMATYEGFEADKAQFQAILAECRSIQSAVQRIQAEVNSKASLVVEYSNNAKTSADKAHSEAERAKIYADNAEAVTGVQIATKERAGLIKGGDNHIAEDGTLMLITTTDSTTQPNSYAGRENILEIGGGESEQDSTEGNQLWNGKYVTVALNKEQDAFTEGTTMAGNIAMPVTVGKQYSLSINGTLAVMRYIFVDADGVGIGSLENASTTSVAPENAVYMKWRVKSHHAETDKIMLNKGTTALPYEKYTGGIPAPNPSYPMEIKNSVVSGVKSHKKNFLQNSQVGTTKTSNGLTFTTNNDGIVIVNGTATADTTLTIKNVTLEKGNYILNGCPKGGAWNTHSIQYNFGKQDVGSGLAITVDSLITANVRILINKGTTLTNAVFKPMIRKADVIDDTYEPYTESVVTLSQPIDLYGMNGVQDVITPKQTKRKFVKYVLDGSDDESFTKEAGFDYVFRHRHGLSNVISYSENQLCTHLLHTDSYNNLTAKEGYFAISSTSILVNVSGITTSPDLKSFLVENPMTFVFELAEEVTEELPIADQIALNSLQTYDGITYVEFDSEIQPTFKAEYGTSKVGGYTLESLLVARNNELKQELANERLSALEASVVNNI